MEETRIKKLYGIIARFPRGAINGNGADVIRKLVSLSGWRLRFHIALAPIIIAGLVLVNTAMPSAAEAATNGTGNIRNLGSGKCLDMTNGSLARGTPPQQWTCNNNLQQYWQVTIVAGGYFRIKNAKSGLCLSVLNNDPNVGGEIIQWTCESTNVFEQWKDYSLGGGFTYLLNRGACANVCAMHPSGSGNANGLKMYMGYPGTNDNHYVWFGQVA
jgi:hypothetical protein